MKKYRKRSESVNLCTPHSRDLFIKEIRSLNNSPIRYESSSTENSPRRNPLRYSGYSTPTGTPRFLQKSFSVKQRHSDEDAWSEDSVSSPRHGIHRLNLQNSEIQLYDKLGEGGSAQVFIGNVNGFSMAIKIYQSIEIEEVAAEIEREIFVLESISHPRIIKCLGHRFEPGKMMLFMEICHGTLQDLIIKQRTLVQNNDLEVIKEHQDQNDNQIDKHTAARKSVIENDNNFGSGQIIHFLKQIAEGLYHLHFEIKPKIIHRDLKPENIFYTQQWEKEHPDLKIGDFGEALLKIKKRGRDEPNMGTLEFRAPEMIAMRKDDLVKYDEKVDIWAFGMILYELVVLDLPYRSEYGNDFLQIEMAIKEGRKPQMPKRGSRIRDRILPILYNECTQQDSKLRPTSKEILDKFFKSYS